MDGGQFWKRSRKSFALSVRERSIRDAVNNARNRALDGQTQSSKSLIEMPLRIRISFPEPEPNCSRLPCSSQKSSLLLIAGKTCLSNCKIMLFSALIWQNEPNFCIFPVLFPVSRENSRQNGSRWTAWRTSVSERAQIPHEILHHRVACCCWAHRRSAIENR